MKPEQYKFARRLSSLALEARSKDKAEIRERLAQELSRHRSKDDAKRDKRALYTLTEIAAIEILRILYLNAPSLRPFAPSRSVEYENFFSDVASGKYIEGYEDERSPNAEIVRSFLIQAASQELLSYPKYIESAEMALLDLWSSLPDQMKQERIVGKVKAAFGEQALEITEPIDRRRLFSRLEENLAIYPDEKEKKEIKKEASKMLDVFTISRSYVEGKAIQYRERGLPPSDYEIGIIHQLRDQVLEAHKILEGLIEKTIPKESIEDYKKRLNDQFEQAFGKEARLAVRERSALLSVLKKKSESIKKGKKYLSEKTKEFEKQSKEIANSAGKMGTRLVSKRRLLSQEDTQEVKRLAQQYLDLHNAAKRLLLMPEKEIERVAKEEKQVKEIQKQRDRERGYKTRKTMW